MTQSKELAEQLAKLHASQPKPKQKAKMVRENRHAIPHDKPYNELTEDQIRENKRAKKRKYYDDHKHLLGRKRHGKSISSYTTIKSKQRKYHVSIYLSPGKYHSKVFDSLDEAVAYRNMMFKKLGKEF